MKKIVSGTLVSLLLISVLTLAFSIPSLAAVDLGEFFATAYYCVYENEMAGTQKVTLTISGIAFTLKASFLFGGYGVAMQGTGRTGPDGHYIHYDGGGGAFVSVDDPEVRARYEALGITDFTGFGNIGLAYPGEATYSVVSGVMGASGRTLVPWCSIAIDPSVIPLGATGILLFKSGTTPDGAIQMKFRADDTGGAIIGNRIDVYVGEGQAALHTWEQTGGNRNVEVHLGLPTFYFPVPPERYKIYADFHDSDGKYVNHLGEDILLDEGTPIRAIADGIIVQYEYHSRYASWDDGTSIAAVIEHCLGRTITLDLRMGDKKTVSIDKVCSIYGHIRKSREYAGDRLPWKVGDYVKKGDIIGYVNDRMHNGDTIEHLHFGIRLGAHPGYWVYYGVESPDIPESNVRYFAAPSEIIPKLDIFAGLEWLCCYQNPDGSWQNSVGITSMAALAFLNAGYDENDPTVSSAIQYILANRRGDGSFGWGTYETSTAVWALVATHNPDYHDETAQAKDWLILAQYDEVEGATAASPCYGGWRYGSSPSDGDLSNTQFALMALDAAYSELGLEKPDPNDPNGWSFKAITFISRCQNRPASNDQPWAHDTTRPSYNDGGFIYHPGGWSLAGGTDSYGSMTAAGIWSLRLCGVAVTDERVQAGLNWLVNNEDCGFDDNPGHPYDQAHCFLYYYYMTIAKALTMCFLHDLGEVDWYAALSARLLQLQYDDGHWVNAPASHGWEDVPELATDYALLALQVKQPPPAKLWMSIILASNAELCVYDPQGRHARLDDVAIPGATFEIDKEGRQIVNLTELEAGKYAIELTGTADGDYSLTINGYRDEEQTFSKTFEGTIKKGQTLVGSALVTSMVGALTIYTEKPMPPPDTIPPTTLLTIGEPKYVTEVTYVTPDTPFNLTAADNPGGTGVALTAYKIRNVTYDSGWLTYTEPFRLTGLIDSVYSIDYNSTDNANNVEPTQTVTVTLFSWNYVFEDTYGRGTILKINIAHKFFQFITPDKDYGITNATNMRLCGRAIIIKHCDSELRLITVAVDTKLDLCVAIAWDKQTRKQYILIDKPGIEE